MSYARLPVVLVFAAASILLVSCSMRQTVSIKNDGSGTASMRVEVAKPFKEYLLSMAEVSGQKELVKEGKIFDLPAIQKDLSAQAGFTLKRIASPSPEILETDIEFKSLNQLLGSQETLKTAGVLSFTDSAGRKTVKVHLDRENYAQMAVLFPVLSDPLFEGMGPQVNDTITEEEYLEMIQFSFGDEGPAMVKKSMMELTIHPEGEIVSQVGGTVSSGAVTFRIPLLKLLLLKEPLDYSVTFR